MRKTVSSVLLGLSLLSPACRSASRSSERAEAVARESMMEHAEAERSVTRAEHSAIQQRLAASDPTAAAPAPEPAKPTDIATASNGAAAGSSAYLLKAGGRQ